MKPNVNTKWVLNCICPCFSDKMNCIYLAVLFVWVLMFDLNPKLL